MDVRLDFPDEVAHRLAADADGVERAALEAIAIEGVRSEKLTVA